MNNQHIDENWDDSSMKEFDDLQKYAFVTKRAQEHNHVGFCYREYSEIKIDSGWRFLYGDEDEDYLDNPENVVVQDLSDIIVWKPELQELLSFRQGSEFEWNTETAKFEKIG